MKENEAINWFYQLDKILNKVGLSHFLMDGTLLGAIRNNKFIPWDDDIDIAILWKEIFDKKINDLYNELCKITDIIYFKYHNQQAFEQNICSGIKVKKQYSTLISADLCPFTKHGNWIYHRNQYGMKLKEGQLKVARSSRKGHIYRVLAYPYDYVIPLKQINFYDMTVNVPNNSEKILISHYGKDWKSPVKNFYSKINFAKWPCRRKLKSENDMEWANENLS